MLANHMNSYVLDHDDRQLYEFVWRVSIMTGNPINYPRWISGLCRKSSISYYTTLSKIAEKLPREDVYTENQKMLPSHAFCCSGLFNRSINKISPEGPRGGRGGGQQAVVEAALLLTRF